jgi:hypothetical protein
MSKIRITLHGNFFFEGSYWLRSVDMTAKPLPSIVAEFEPVDCECSLADARAAADWLVNNRLDMDRITLTDEAAYTLHETRKTIYA